MSGNIQLKGAAMIAPTGDPLVDRSGSISMMMIKRSRNSVTEPATLETGRESEAAGTLSEQLVMQFHSSLAASSFWADLYDVLDTDSSQIDFQATLEEGVRGTDNPEFSGTATLLDLETGANVGALRQQTITLPITAAGVAKNVTPA